MLRSYTLHPPAAAADDEGPAASRIGVLLQECQFHIYAVNEEGERRALTKNRKLNAKRGITLPWGSSLPDAWMLAKHLALWE